MIECRFGFHFAVCVRPLILRNVQHDMVMLCQEFWGKRARVDVTVTGCSVLTLSQNRPLYAHLFVPLDVLADQMREKIVQYYDEVIHYPVKFEFIEVACLYLPHPSPVLHRC